MADDEEEPGDPELMTGRFPTWALVLGFLIVILGFIGFILAVIAYRGSH